MKLLYSNDKPTRPGFYWYRDLRGREEIIECGFRDGELVVLMTEADCLYQQFMDGEFAGPIPAPAQDVELMSSGQLVEIIRGLTNAGCIVPSECDGSLSCHFCGEWSVSDEERHLPTCVYVAAKAIVTG